MGRLREPFDTRRRVQATAEAYRGEVYVRRTSRYGEPTDYRLGAVLEVCVRRGREWTPTTLVRATGKPNDVVAVRDERTDAVIGGVVPVAQEGSSA